MEKTVVRNVVVSAVLCAGLGISGVALAATNSASNDADGTAAASSTADTVKGAASSKADSSSAAGDATSGTYTDGTYEASAKGIGGDVPVTVTIEGGVITSVEVGENNETQGVGSKAIEQLPAEIVAANGTDGVEAVSGASVTSKAIFTAVEDCLEQASA